LEPVEALLERFRGTGDLQPTDVEAGDRGSRGKPVRRPGEEHGGEERGQDDQTDGEDGPTHREPG
jgi:hypothetical protein